MLNSKNISFERNFPKHKFKSKKNINKKFISDSLKNVKNTPLKKDTFDLFKKNFKLNLDLTELNKYRKYQRIIIIGMGGSILGAQAAYNFLNKKIKKKIIFINNLDTDFINEVNKIKNLKNSLFLLISKSGNTIEILSIIDSLKSNAQFNKTNTLIITENKRSQLNLFAQKSKIKVIFHRSYIGGRFSIFSETGLVPCYLMGINVNKLKKNILYYLQKGNSSLTNNLLNLANIYSSRKIKSLILLNYCSGLEHFLLWCQQLIAESLGKNGKGIIPIVSLAPRDHHSLLQLYLDGPQDKFYYIFSNQKNKKNKKVSNFFYDILKKSNVSQIIKSQNRAMISLLKSKKSPFLSLDLKERNEETLGELFSYFIIETIILAKSLKINPFNQPAVEKLKILTKKNLSKKNQI